MQYLNKELMTVILGTEVIDVLGVDENNIDYTCFINREIGYRDVSINMHELANKCKEWVNKQGYKKVYSGIYESTDQGSLYICIIDSKEGKYNLDFWADTEVEAIFKASEWILNNKGE